MRHGSQIDPPNRFDAVSIERDLEQLEWEVEYRQSIENRQIQYIADSSQSIVSENESPDLPFRYSINPYRGCSHGCPYFHRRPASTSSARRLPGRS